MKMVNKIVFILIGLGTFFIIPASQSTAFDKFQKFRYQYAAQFTCGVDPPPAIFRVVPGRYATAINIHNPNDRRITFKKKVALTFPPAEQTGGAVFEFQTDTLEPNQALQVDCQEIPGFFDEPIGPPYFQGYVVIQTPKELDVNATYTAGSVGEGDDVPPIVNAIAVQEISAKRLR